MNKAVHGNGYLAIISWLTGRLVRGQILSLREQDFIVATTALDYPIDQKSLSIYCPIPYPIL